MSEPSTGLVGRLVNGLSRFFSSEADTAEPTPPALSRREFIGAAVATGAAVAVGGTGLVQLGTWERVPAQPVAEGVIYPEPSLCIGCLTCEVICSRVHREVGLSELPRIRIYNDKSVQIHPEIQKNYPDRGSFLQQPCLQCTTAECVYVCPVHAFKIEPKTGARYIDEKVCVTCGRCAQACPFPVSSEDMATNQQVFGQQTRISYDPEKDVFTKCDLCYWRPEGPACVERCPVNIRIHQGIIKSDKLCLDNPRNDQATWDRLRQFQTLPGSPAPKAS